MPRVSVTSQTIDRDGTAATYAAPTVDNISFANDGKKFLHVKNGSAAPINVTIVTPGTVDSLPIPEKVVAVPAGGERFIGPFPASIYNNSADRSVYVDFSAQAGVTYALLGGV